jgi:hypothetical protein
MSGTAGTLASRVKLARGGARGDVGAPVQAGTLVLIELNVQPLAASARITNSTRVSVVVGSLANNARC